MTDELTEDVIYRAMRKNGEWLTSTDVINLTGFTRRVVKFHLKKFYDMEWVLDRKKIGRGYQYRIKK